MLPLIAIDRQRMSGGFMKQIINLRHTADGSQQLAIIASLFAAGIQSGILGLGFIRSGCLADHIDFRTFFPAATAAQPC